MNTTGKCNNSNCTCNFHVFGGQIQTMIGTNFNILFHQSIEFFPLGEGKKISVCKLFFPSICVNLMFQFKLKLVSEDSYVAKQNKF